MATRFKVDLWTLWMKVVIQFGFKAQVHVLLQIAHLSVHTISSWWYIFVKAYLNTHVYCYVLLPGFIVNRERENRLSLLY